MQVRDYLSYDWQTVGSVQVALAKAGIALPEVKLRKVLESLPGVVFHPHDANQVRKTTCCDKD